LRLTTRHACCAIAADAVIASVIDSSSASAVVMVDASAM
jgi:hypothetical protein